MHADPVQTSPGTHAGQQAPAGQTHELPAQTRPSAQAGTQPPASMVPVSVPASNGPVSTALPSTMVASFV